MKKLVAVFGFILMVFSAQTMADPTSELKGRLANVSTLHANFTQEVYAADKKLVQKGSGELWLKRPNLFRWHMVDPDESVLVSDGKTLWFYNPFVEQVTITWLNSATDNTPFMLITRNSDTEWKKYAITQKGDNFVLTPKVKKSDLKPFEINVTKDGLIRSFIAKETDGQRSIYQLSNHSNAAVSADKFTFVVPKGITVDDQR
jgi:outer membrane lipoprotein carrier protein